MSEIPNPNDPTYHDHANGLLRQQVTEAAGRAGPDVIRVYVCACGNYFGSSSMGRLEEQQNLGTTGSATPGQVVSRRSRCPDCGGQRRERYARLIPDEDVAEARRRVQRERVAEETRG